VRKPPRVHRSGFFLIQCIGDFQPAASRPTNKQPSLNPSIPAGLSDRGFPMPGRPRSSPCSVRATRNRFCMQQWSRQIRIFISVLLCISDALSHGFGAVG